VHLLRSYHRGLVVVALGLAGAPARAIEADPATTDGAAAFGDTTAAAGLSAGLYRRAEGDGALVNRLDLAASLGLGRGLFVEGHVPAALVRSHPGAAARDSGAAIGNLGLGLRGDWSPGDPVEGGVWFTGGLVASLPTASSGQAAVDAEALHRVRHPGDFRDLAQMKVHAGVGLREGSRRLLAELALITVLERGKLQFDAPTLRVRAADVLGPRTFVGGLHVLLDPSWDALALLELGFDQQAATLVVGPRVMIPLMLPELGLVLGLAARWP
jgi:hypothetical protein